MRAQCGKREREKKPLLEISRLKKRNIYYKEKNAKKRARKSKFKSNENRTPE